MHHELKTDAEVFEESWVGLKPWEIRKNDRNFEVGDTVRLRETVYSGIEMANGAPLMYSGRELVGKITYVFCGPMYALPKDWVIFSLNLA